MPAAETTAPQPGQPAIEGEPSAQRAKQRYQMHGGLTDNLSVMTGTSAGSKDRAQLGLRRQLDLSNVVYFDDAPNPACSNTILLMDVGGLSTQLSEPVTITLTTDFETASNTNAANAWPTADDVSALITHPGGEMTRTSAYFLGSIVIYNELPQSNQRQFPAATITVTADRMASVVGYAVDSLASTMPSWNYNQPCRHHPDNSPARVRLRWWSTRFQVLQHLSRGSCEWHFIFGITCNKQLLHKPTASLHFMSAAAAAAPKTCCDSQEISQSGGRCARWVLVLVRLILCGYAMSASKVQSAWRGKFHSVQPPSQTLTPQTRQLLLVSSSPQVVCTCVVLLSAGQHMDP